MTGIVAASEELYSAFADVPKPDVIEGCPCCIDESELGRLLSVPLREIPGPSLAPYASSALLTVGTEEDYLYFLPRILDISIAEAHWWPCIEVTGRAIGMTKPDEWSNVHKDAVQRFFESAIEHLVAEGEFDRIDDWVCGAGRAGFAVEPLLKIVERDDAAILEFFNCNAGALSERKLQNEFWEPWDRGQDEILDWFMTEKVRRVPYEAYGYRIFE